MHESLYQATLIEFTIWNNNTEKSIAIFNSFQDLPHHLHDELEKNSSEITLKGKKWNIVEIGRDLCQHGDGTHVKVRLEPRD
ncbi:MAG: hypothetical protein J4F36_06450 [Nitrosopumilaceae archaeon]|nr:hypothetical protein [Nitrosopumilaceae archaeon]